MTEILSFALAALVIIGVLAFGLALIFEGVCRLRDRLLPPSVQLRRADLGNYPYWRD